ncbi:MAG: UDP-N-acetylmuramate--L-alanine ligase, partial [Limnochordia bacterium]
RVIAVFQPHRYSRTKFLLVGFSRAFSDADVVVLTDIFAPPPEQPIPGVSAELIAAKIRDLGKEVYFIPEQADIAGFLAGIVQGGDLVITMGAGPIWKSARDLCRLLA